VAGAGEVRVPNVHLLRPGTTLPEAIAAAGGYGERGDPGEIVLRRGADDYEIDLTDPASPHVVTTVRSGDQIVVGRDAAVFRDYVLPAFGIVGTLASLYRVFDR
jgi:protein involved in polysaccharide export with SLBB domain